MQPRFMMVFVVLSCGACGPPLLDTQRQSIVPRSTGSAVYEELCNRLSYGADPNDVSGVQQRAVCRDGAEPASDASASLRALHQQRVRLIAALDAVLAPPTAMMVQQLLTELLPLYDSGLMQQTIASLSMTLTSLEDSSQALAAFGQIAADPNTASASASLLSFLLTYPRLSQLLDAMFEPDQPRPRLRDAWNNLQQSLYGTLLTADTLNSHVAAWLSKIGAVAPDGQSLVAALVRALQQIGGGHMTAVFAAAHAADAMALQPMSGSQDDVAAGFKVDEAVRTELVASARVIGAAVDRINAAATPQIGEQPTVPAWLQVVDTLLREHPDEVARWLQQVQRLTTLGEAPTDAPLDALVDDLAKMIDAIAAEPGLLRAIVAALHHPDTKLLGPLLAKHMRYGDRFDLDPNDLNGPYVHLGPARVDHGLSDQTQVFVDADKTDATTRTVALGNMSLMQRLLHLVHDARQQVCNNNDLRLLGVGRHRYLFGEFGCVDDAALLYLRAVAGRATIMLRVSPDEEPGMPEMVVEAMRSTDPEDPQLSLFSGLRGMLPIPAGQEGVQEQQACAFHGVDDYTCVTFTVTPQAAARMLFGPYRPDVQNPYDGSSEGTRIMTFALLKDMFHEMEAGGVPFSKLHGATLFAWEEEPFFKALRPLVLAFSDHDREDLLVALLDTLHRHYPSPDNRFFQRNSPNLEATYSELTNLRAWEEKLATMLDEGAALTTVAEILDTLAGLQIQGQSGLDIFSTVLMQQLAADHDAPKVAGTLLQAFNTLKLRWLRYNPPAQTEVTPATPIRASQFVATAAPLVQSVVAHWADLSAGEVSFGVALPEVVETMLSSPLLANGLHFLAEVDQQPELRPLMADLADLIVCQHGDALAYVAQQSTQVFGSTALQALPQAAAVAVLPDTGLLALGAQLLQGAWREDTQDSMIVLFSRLGTPVPALDGETPLATFTDVYSQVTRADPLSSNAMTAADFAAMVPTLRRFLQDPEHGLQRLLDLVAGRHGDVAVSVPSETKALRGSVRERLTMGEDRR